MKEKRWSEGRKRRWNEEGMQSKRKAEDSGIREGETKRESEVEFSCSRRLFYSASRDWLPKFPAKILIAGEIMLRLMR